MSLARAIGETGALLLTRVMRSMLVGVTPTDPATYVTMGKNTRRSDAALTGSRVVVARLRTVSSSP
jgi:ABC-type phosphate transport system permease subunit